MRVRVCCTVRCNSRGTATAGSSCVCLGCYNAWGTATPRAGDGVAISVPWQRYDGMAGALSLLVSVSLCLPWPQVVDFAPFAIRSSTWRDLGGLDEGVSRKGDCGITSDFEISMRAWIGGWKVGFSCCACATHCCHNCVEVLAQKACTHALNWWALSLCAFGQLRAWHAACAFQHALGASSRPSSFGCIAGMLQAPSIDAKRRSPAQVASVSVPRFPHTHAVHIQTRLCVG